MTLSASRIETNPAKPPVVDPLLWLLQVSDSALPIGGYSHSWGLETAVQQQRITSKETTLDYLSGLLQQAIAPQEGTACALAHHYSATHQEDAFFQLQAHLTAARWAEEPRKATYALGQRLQRWGKSTWGLNCPDGEQLHHCAVFGWLCQQAGVGQPETVSAYLSGSMANLVSAAVRLVPLGHSDGQALLAQLQQDIVTVLPTCLAAAHESASAPLAPLSQHLHGFAPLLERDCQAHRHLYTRLFQS